MRTRLMGMVAALLLVSAGAKAQDAKGGDAGGQKDIPKQTVSQGVADIAFTNQIDFGLRGSSFADNSDKARFQRYQDLRDGGFLDKIRFRKTTDAYVFTAQADHVGYRDQRFSGAYNNYGKVKASFEWNQTPLYFSQDTRTLYNTSTPGVLTLSDGIQSGIQNKTLTLGSAVGGASVFDLRSQRDTANFNLVYSANRYVDLNITLKNTLRSGEQPWAGSFGISGAVATEMPVPIDHRTTEFGTNLEFSNNRAFARFGYEGSYFRNNVTSLTWDNPSRVADSPTAGPAQGRMSLWPNTDSNTVTATGGLNLPGRSHATAYLSVGTLSNNDPLLPFTVNSAITPIPLDRSTAEVKARVTAMNYNFTSRPTSMLWFSARYRQYEFDNQTPPFTVLQSVNYDTSVVTLNGESEALGYKRHTFDADASFSPVTYLGLRAGYTREEVDRTFRIVENTKEDTLRASIDATGITWLTLRGVYEHSKRAGSEVDVAELIAIGEQPSLRQFDISDRNKDRVSGIVQIMPISQFSINASASVGKEDYPGTGFGLRNNDNHVYSVGFDVVPSDKVSFGGSYGYEKYTALQASRTANPLPAGASLTDPTQQFNDPRRDWTDNSSDQVRTVNASLDLLKVLAKTDIKVAYDYSYARSLYVYGLAPNTVIVAPVQLPAVTNELQRGTIDGRYFVTRHLALGLTYWYDKYDVNDFALGPTANGLAQPATTPALMMLGYFYRPYTANTVIGRLTYLW
jgi:MtrB/PioB family decaheme-associated outer membrane protein